MSYIASSDVYKIMLYIGCLLSLNITSFFHIISIHSSKRSMFILGIILMLLIDTIFVYIHVISGLYYEGRREYIRSSIIVTNTMLIVSVLIAIYSMVSLIELAIYFRSKVNLFSIVESYDKINYGILYYTPEKIILSNKFMNRITYVLFGSIHLNGDFLWKKIESGKYIAKLSDSYIYSSNGKYYSFSKENSSSYTSILCYDITMEYNMNLLIEKQNKRLLEIEAELNQSIQNIEPLAQLREQEIMKNKMHNAISHRIVMLTGLIEGKKMNISTIKNAKSVMDEVKNTNLGILSHEIDLLNEDLKQIDAEIITSGVISRDLNYTGLFLDIIKEAATNAIQHGGANEIYVYFIDDLHFEIRNNGEKPKTIQFGGGLSGLTLRAYEVGGSLVIKNDDEFVITYLGGKNESINR